MREPKYGRVERIWAGETAVILASGPSLTTEDVTYVRGKAKVIAINSSVERAMWADCLYACDDRWWVWHRGMTEFKGLKFALTSQSARWPGVVVLRNSGAAGLETNPSGLRNGRNGGYQALGLAYHFGVSRVVLLGYDMQRGTKGEWHWHEDHPSRMQPSFHRWLTFFEGIAPLLKKAGVEVINCTRSTALKAFPRMPLESVL